MNNILQLKGRFEHRPNNSNVGPKNLPVGCYVTSNHMSDLKMQLAKLLEFWKKETVINGALISVHYKTVVAKSNRIAALLSKGALKSNDSIKGSKFENVDSKQRHVFTHYVGIDVLEYSINNINKAINIVESNYNGKITYDDILRINDKIVPYNYSDVLAKTTFIQIIIDSYFVDRFDIDRDVDELNEQAIVTIYKTDIKTKDLLSKFGIIMFDAKMIDETTIRLDPDELKILKSKAPYLIAMATCDISKMTQNDILHCDNSVISIPHPKKEPVIGVIDTLFSENVYFSEWVTYKKIIDDNIPISDNDYFHGTAVTSIIVDGPSFNPALDDGCGRFRVRHFGVATSGQFSAFSILKAIREIVANNRDIKVWNLSLGSAMEIHKNFISPEGAELDKIQSEYDVVFIVAGTNKPRGVEGEMRIGAPADSLNSLVVNSVDENDNPASYHRVGPVLSFFYKPDVSYYGGDGTKKIRVCSQYGEAFVTGTSFAAPWITRKMAYLIYNMGFSREVAKALIIDSAAGWNERDDASHSVGYGVVPIHIDSIIKSPEDEIRFIMTGSTDSYETYTYNLPVPSVMDKHPFFARATLCYFPNCSRNQGVDYTNTEMDIHFGRVKEDKEGKVSISSINANIQGNEGVNILYEESARKLYRKWDNIKHISDVIKKGSKARKKYGSGFWGISIKTKERLQIYRDSSTPFGIVITLKEMNGVNRIDDFMKLCMVRGWIVNRVDVKNRVEVYNRAEEDIELE